MEEAEAKSWCAKSGHEEQPEAHDEESLRICDDGYLGRPDSGRAFLLVSITMFTLHQSSC